MARKPAKKTSINVDFSDTESSAVLPESDYLLKVADVEVRTSENSGADYLSFTMEVAEGEFEGKKVYHNCSLQPQALFNLRNLLEALGLEVPQGAMDLDPADLIDMTCGVSIQHETYEGKTKARPVEFFPEEDLGGEEEAEAPAAKVTKKAVKEEPVKKTPAKKAVKEEPAAEPAKKVMKKKTVKKEIEVGSIVTFTDDEGDEQEGGVTAIEDDNATVLVDEDEWEIPMSDLVLVS